MQLLGINFGVLFQSYYFKESIPNPYSTNFPTQPISSVIDVVNRLKMSGESSSRLRYNLTKTKCNVNIEVK
ncbi:hypothetical protein GIB67_028317 [Kingdonia uniflora]|uniref:Uncharacterized protein n=1 Tax=Kingdonia uniflora TaxID=39325 RepID=A0A7J7MHM8_9MAGN|nr:hypothetical protein GIB67_028317 [Kingdonia uniflora]